MKLSIGDNLDNPFVIKKDDIDHSRISLKIETKENVKPIYASFSGFHSILDSVFGQNDGDYFILGENSLNVKNHKYVVYYIEDRDTVKHTVFFRIEG